MNTNNLHQPAPTQRIISINFYLDQMRKMYAGIYHWARAGFRDCQLLANIVGKTRPYYAKTVPDRLLQNSQNARNTMD